MCRALELWEQRRDERYQRLRQLRDEFEHRITAEFPDVVVHGAQAPRLPNTTSLSFPGINRQALVIALDMVGVECSTGSACASGSSEPSATLTAMQLDNALIQSAIRFSFGAFQAKEEVAAAIERTIRVVRRLRNLPPNSTPKSPQKPAISL
jgi:cysteine desulfurase